MVLAPAGAPPIEAVRVLGLDVAVEDHWWAQ